MPNGRYTWVVTRHWDCVTVLRDPDCSAQKFPSHLLHQLAADPAAPFAVIARTVLGMMLVKDDELSLVLASANRDPAVFADPDRLDLFRGENRHLSFGFGAHFCLGASLARLEGQIALGSVVARFPAMKLASESVEWKPGIVLRGLASLPIRL